MGNLAEALEDMKVAAEADFSYLEHAPDWLELDGARVCIVCGVVGLGDSPGRVLPTGVVRGGGPRLDEDAEEFYRQEKQS